jgi:transformation/transcription domain-associated protein
MINSIHIMHSLCQFEGNREWMEKMDSIWFKRVGESLEACVRKKSLPSHLAAEQASEQLMDIFVKFLEYHHPVDLDALLRLVESMTTNDFSATHPLCTYIYRYIICENSIQLKKSFVMQSIEAYASASQKSKTFLIRNIVQPIIRQNSKQESSEGLQLVDKAMIESIHAKIWKVGLSSPDDDLAQPGIDRTRMEVLQLTAMLVKYYPSILHDMWQDIIEFCSNYIRCEDIFIKSCRSCRRWLLHCTL